MHETAAACSFIRLGIVSFADAQNSEVVTKVGTRQMSAANQVLAEVEVHRSGRFSCDGGHEVPLAEATAGKPPAQALSAVPTQLPRTAQGPCDSVALHRSLLRAAAEGGADPRRLARDAGLSAAALESEGAMLPARCYTRLWEVVERALEQPLVPLAMAARHRVGELGLYDYLFASAATLGEGMSAAGDFLHLVTTNGRLGTHDAGQEITYTYRHVEPGGRGQELCLLYGVALWCLRARAATGRRIVPSRVTFPVVAPRSHRLLAEAFGTQRMVFGAPTASVSFSPADLDTRMMAADARLTGMLRRFAASLPFPRPDSFPETLRLVIAEAIEQGTPSLCGVAARLAISSRTLQRRLAEHGTGWRQELDAARRTVASSADDQSVKMASLARRLGYSDPRSARRALRRWAQAGGPDTTRHQYE